MNMFSADLIFAFAKHSKLTSMNAIHPFTPPSLSNCIYRGADKSLAITGKKQARKHVRDARDLNDIEKRAVIKFFFSARQGAEGNSHHSDRNISLFPSWLG